MPVTTAAAVNTPRAPTHITAESTAESVRAKRVTPAMDSPAKVRFDWHITMAVVVQLPRDTMLKRGSSRRPMSVCLSVCPSVKLGIDSKRIKIIVKLFFDLVRPSF